MPVFLKASDQAGIQGSLIFDPVGTNEYIKHAMSRLSWKTNLSIPSDYDFLGTDVDFFKAGLLAEAQFSNYPFLLNNVVRSEIFVKGAVRFDGTVVDAVVIVTKAHMFPSSNSTLYYEQAKRQLQALARHRVLSVPLRLVGLFTRIGSGVPVTFTEYTKPRYSRSVSRRVEVSCNILRSTTARGRCRMELTDPGQEL